MKYSIIILILFLCACDNREDLYEKINKTPELKIQKAGIEKNLSKSLIDSVKFNFGPYLIEYSISDEEQIQPECTILSGGGILSMNYPTKIISFNPSLIGLNKLHLRAKDSFKKESISNVDLVVFENLLPQAFLDITNTKINSPYEININAVKSYDRDKKYGGKIIEYEYKIGQIYSVITPLNAVSYIFDKPGTYAVSVRVKDNNNAWSEIITKPIRIN